MSGWAETTAHYWDRLFTYDTLKTAGGKQRWFLCAIPFCFVLVAVFMIAAREVDNQGIVASSALMKINHIALNPMAWLKHGLWYAAITPTPMHNSALAFLFAIFGYDTRIAMAATVIVSGAGCLLLGEITRQRFGLSAGLIAQVLYVTAPVILRYSLSAGYYVWATTPLLLCICLLDSHQIRQQSRFYFLAAIALLCAGMSRPEIFALAIPIVIVVPMAFRYRAVFLGIAWLYPIVSAVFTRVKGLPTPGTITARALEGFGSAVKSGS